MSVKKAIVAACAALLMLSANAEDRQEFCQAVAGNVVSGHQAKALMGPAELEEKLMLYTLNLLSQGIPKIRVEQLVRAVQTGYAATKNVELLAERAFAQCMAQKET